jgi:hypothetical protein
VPPEAAHGMVALAVVAVLTEPGALTAMGTKNRAQPAYRARSAASGSAGRCHVEDHVAADAARTVAAAYGLPAERCVNDCLTVAHAYAQLGIAAEVRITELTVTDSVTGTAPSTSALSRSGRTT